MKSIICSVFFLLPLFAFGQLSIAGHVVSPDGTGLKGVTIEAAGTTSGTVTLGDGAFTLNLPAGTSLEEIILRSKDLKKPFTVELPQDHYGDWGLYVVLDPKKKNRRYILVRN